jgi:hypothetical protein
VLVLLRQLAEGREIQPRDNRQLVNWSTLSTISTLLTLSTSPNLNISENFRISIKSLYLMYES